MANQSVSVPNLSAELARYSMTQKEFAENVGINNTTISNWMNGRSVPSVADAFRVRDALPGDLTVDYLFSSKPMPPAG